MEIGLAQPVDFSAQLPDGYRFVPWDPLLIDAHAEVKYHSFRFEIDSHVFPCLGDFVGCLRLMTEIARKPGFVPEATWLVVYDGAGPKKREYCGTVQGIRDDAGFGSIQNLGVTPHHRGRGLGAALMQQSLAGFASAGLARAYLEVTVQNESAVRLYENLGFRRTTSSYKAVEVAYS